MNSAGCSVAPLAVPPLLLRPCCHLTHLGHLLIPQHKEHTGLRCARWRRPGPQVQALGIQGHPEGKKGRSSQIWTDLSGYRSEWIHMEARGEGFQGHLPEGKEGRSGQIWADLGGSVS